MKKYILVIVAAICMASSCKKEEPVDSTKPTIQLLSPANHDTFTVGDTVHYVVQVSDNDKLRQVTFEVKLIDNTPIITMSQDLMGDSRSFEIDTNYIITQPGFGQLNHRITATDGNDNTAVVSGHVHEHH